MSVGEPFAFLIVGGGPAGFSAAGAYRAAGGAGAVAIVSDEARMPYRRPPLTKELLRGELEEGELPMEDEAWLAEQDVVLIDGRAVALDPAAREVTLSGGRRLPYATCLIATGAEPLRLPIHGADDPGVLVLRSVEHLRELNLRLVPGARVVVIGSGFIGCEIAASLRMRAHPVTVISDEPAPNLTRLGPEAASRIAAWLDALGVERHAGRAVERIERRGDRLAVHAGDLALPAAVVVMASGVAPRGELALAAGLELTGGAIPVDASMRTAIPGLLAAGDVVLAENAAAGRPLRVEHWGEALAHGEVAGRVAAGLPARWSEVPGFWSAIGPHRLKYAAWGDGYEAERFASRGNGAFAVFYGRDGRYVGVLAHDSDEDYERGRELVGMGAPWPS